MDREPWAPRWDGAADWDLPLTYPPATRTPLHCAASCNDTAICTALVQHGAAIFATTLSDGATAIEKCDPYREGYADCATYLAGARLRWRWGVGAGRCVQVGGDLGAGVTQSIQLICILPEEQVVERPNKLSSCCSPCTFVILVRNKGKQKERWYDTLTSLQGSHLEAGTLVAVAVLDKSLQAPG